MRFRIEDHEWYICPACRYVFTDELMRYKYMKRLQQREDYLASIKDPEKRADLVRKLGKLGNCPKCGHYGVHPIIKLGARDRRAFLVKAFFMEIGEWLKSIVRAS